MGAVVAAPSGSRGGGTGVQHLPGGSAVVAVRDDDDDDPGSVRRLALTMDVDTTGV